VCCRILRRTPTIAWFEAKDAAADHVDADDLVAARAFAGHEPHGDGPLHCSIQKLLTDQRRHGRIGAQLLRAKRERDQFRRISGRVVGSAYGPADVDANIATLGPARLCQRLCKCRNAALLCRIVRRKSCEHADAPHSLTPHRRTAEQGDELAPFQLIELHSVPSN
jgi:hypothetical protein